MFCYNSCKEDVVVRSSKLNLVFIQGLYHIRVKGYTENMERVLFCGEVTQYIQQNITITAEADIVV